MGLLPPRRRPDPQALRIKRYIIYKKPHRFSLMRLFYFGEDIKTSLTFEQAQMKAPYLISSPNSEAGSPAILQITAKGFKLISDDLD